LAHPRLVFGNPEDYAGGLTFDGEGNLWGATMADPSLRGTSFIFELTPVQLDKLAHHKRVMPAIEIDGAGGAAVHLDSAGDLWVVIPSGIPSLVMYTPNQLVNGTAPGPARELTFFSGIGDITDFAFDGGGNLWLDSDYSGNADYQAALSELTPDQLSASGSSIVPHLQLLGAAGKALVFDSKGDLWAATEYGTYMYTPGELTGAGVESIDPAITIDSYYGLDGLAFDAEGDLWVASPYDMDGENHGGIAEFSADQIISSGEPQAKVVLRANRYQTNLGGPSLITFGPGLN
jgi:ligand-binding sensor domain-containing protein